MEDIVMQNRHKKFFTIQIADPKYKQMDFMINLRRKHRQSLFRIKRPYLNKTEIIIQD